MTIHKRGFTLIELLVVIAIIGILSSVVLASLNTARQKSRDAKRVSDVKQLQLALELYFDSNGGYPSTAQGTGVLATAGFIASVPTDPFGDPYNFGSNGTVATDDGTDYVLGITLEDTGHTVLDNDIDADEFGVSCDAAGEYCVKP